MSDGGGAIDFDFGHVEKTRKHTVGLLVNSSLYIHLRVPACLMASPTPDTIKPLDRCSLFCSRRPSNIDDGINSF
jgi:hypothetical protein